MKHWVSGLALLCAINGCAVGPIGPAESAFNTSSPVALAGEWRSVTPSLEFIGLSVVSKASEVGVLAARLTFSGVAWEGDGRMTGDSLVASMTMVGAQTAQGEIRARARDERTLLVRFQPGAVAPFDIAFVREH